MTMLDALNPGFKAIHYDPADGPTECVTLLAQHFVSTLWETLANMPTYGEWLLAVDETDAYAYHHDVLAGAAVARAGAMVAEVAAPRTRGARAAMRSTPTRAPW